LQKIEFLSLEKGQSETIPGRRDAARAPVRQSANAPPPPPPGVRAPGPHPEAASESCPLLAPRADRPANTQRTAGPFHAFPVVRSSLGRRLLLEASSSDHQSQAITQATIKGRCPSASRQAAPSPALHPCPPRRATSSGRLRTKTGCSSPSLASAIASRAVHFLAQAATSPERGVPRSVTAGAAARPRRPFPRLNRARESVP
jgi:hypothetical protein